jgi:hypothetical protein
MMRASQQLTRLINLKGFRSSRELIDVKVTIQELRPDGFKATDPGEI